MSSRICLPPPPCLRRPLLHEASRLPRSLRSRSALSGWQPQESLQSRVPGRFCASMPCLLGNQVKPCPGPAGAAGPAIPAGRRHEGPGKRAASDLCSHSATQDGPPFGLGRRIQAGPTAIPARFGSLRGWKAQPNRNGRWRSSAAQQRRTNPSPRKTALSGAANKPLRD
jgi:hypothetical protein